MLVGKAERGQIVGAKRHAIEYRLGRKGVRQLWAWFEGSRKAARRSAEGLLVSLREESGYPKARVFIDGRRVDKVAACA